MNQHFAIYEYGTPHRGTIFLFGGWRTRKFMYLIAIKRLNRLGWRCVLFIPNQKLISIGASYRNIINAANTADNYVTKTIASSTADAAYICMGVSLGTLYAAEMAKRHPEINKLILSAPFGDFNTHVKLWQDHWYFGRVLRSQPTTIQGSAALLNTINTSNDIELLADKQIIVCYANNDAATHTVAAEPFIKRLQRVNPSLIVHKANGSHYGGILRNYYWLEKNHQDFFTKST